ncbi:ribosomal RNA small subunit methyltransferase A [Candidatus Uhrbacteria bacterium]|nr:ribosomal RNA small subunit methyltransferase A [Candidatus Uhrbacteria bacterium]
MQSLSSPLQILRSYGIEPRRSRGQNFLIDRNIIRKIIEKADLKKTDTVVEIGAGIGALTRELANRVKKVFAVEIDEKLIEVLQNGSLIGSGMTIGNIEIIRADARTLPNATFTKKEGSYRVIANIPYNLTSLLIRKFLEESPRPSDMILMIQKEVGKRICAHAGEMSILSSMVQYYAVPKILFPVSKTCFFPAPKVNSVCISLALKKDRIPASQHAKEFTHFVKAGFSAKRKLLSRNLSHGLKIPVEDIKKGFFAAQIPLNARAQELSVDDWISLCYYINN